MTVTSKVAQYMFLDVKMCLKDDFVRFLGLYGLCSALVHGSTELYRKVSNICRSRKRIGPKRAIIKMDSIASG